MIIELEKVRNCRTLQWNQAKYVNIDLIPITYIFFNLISHFVQEKSH